MQMCIFFSIVGILYPDFAFKLFILLSILVTYYQYFLIMRRVTMRTFMHVIFCFLFDFFHLVRFLQVKDYVKFYGF